MQDAALGVSLVAMVGTVANLVIGRLKERDKLAFDAKHQAELNEVKHKQAMCEKESAWLREKVAEQGEQIAELKQRDTKDRAELQAQINTVKANLPK